MCKTTDNAATVEASVGKLKDQVRLAEESKDERMTAIMKEALEKEEENLAACKKKGGVTQCVATLQRAELDLASKEVARVAEFERLQEKAKAKTEENLATMELQIQALLERKKAYAAAMKATADAHAERHAYLAERSKQKIAAVRSRLPPAHVTQLQVLATQSPPQDAGEMVNAAAMEVEAKEQADFTIPVQWTAEELPVVTETRSSDKMLYAILAQILQEWLQFGTAVRFSYSQLLNAPVDFVPAMLSLAKLLGPVLTRMYVDRRVMPTDIVPNALGYPLLKAVWRLDPAHMTVEQPAKEVISATAAKTLKTIQKKMKKAKGAVVG